MASHNRCERALPVAGHAADSAAMQQTARRPVSGSITTAGVANAKRRPTSVQFWSPFVDSFIWRQDLAPCERRFDMNSTRSKACVSVRQHTSPFPPRSGGEGSWVGGLSTRDAGGASAEPPPSPPLASLAGGGDALSLAATMPLPDHGFAPSVCGANKRIELLEGNLC
jgi:hypothetical protein